MTRQRTTFTARQQEQLAELLTPPPVTVDPKYLSGRVCLTCGRPELTDEWWDDWRCEATWRQCMRADEMLRAGRRWPPGEATGCCYWSPVGDACFDTHLMPVIKILERRLNGPTCYYDEKVLLLHLARTLILHQANG